MSTDLYTAMTSDPEADAPLVFAFHGTGGNEAQLFKLAQQLVPGAGVISPRGDVSENGAPRFFRRAAEGVYDMDDLARATEKMQRFVAAHKEAAAGREVFAFGYSNGANILASAFLAQPYLFDRVALLHPLVTWTPEARDGLTGRRVLVTGGRNDPISPLGKTEELIDLLQKSGADVTSHLHDGGHEMRRTELTALEDHFKR